MSTQLNFFSIKIIFLKKIYPTWKLGCLHFQRYLWRLTLWSKVQIGHTGISYISKITIWGGRGNTVTFWCQKCEVDTVDTVVSCESMIQSHVIGECLQSRFVQKSCEICTYVFTSNFFGIMRFCIFLFEISFPILFSVSFSNHG